MSTKHHHYFKGGTWFERALRFLNLLEPGHMVLSLSKLAVWATVAAVGYVVAVHPESASGVIGSLAAFGVATSNYAYRRHKQYASGASPYPQDCATVPPSKPEDPK